MRKPFAYNGNCVVDQVLKCELIELQASTELCDAFREMSIKSVTPFWQYLLKKGGFQRMQEIALRILSRFGFTYSCESAFSVMGALKSKTRNKLSDENLDRQLILAVNNFLDPQWSGLDRLNAQFSH